MTTENPELKHDWMEEFESIRSFHDHEVPEHVAQLLGISDIQQILSQFLPSGESGSDTNLEHLFAQCIQATSITEFQQSIRDHALPVLFSAFDSIDITGIDQLDPDLPYLYISNHRDIVLDPLLLLAALDKNQFVNSHSAIGDNLLQHPVSDQLAKLTRCFSVFRSIKSPKAALRAMKVQSSYMRYVRFNLQESIWIAQKEGRAKDGIDVTNPALVKMLSLARPKPLSMGAYLQHFRIVPVSFSYEWDPCDSEKARELLISSDEGNYEKSSLDDLKAVRKGLVGGKGRVHVHFDANFQHLNISEMNHQEIASRIDESIQENYFIYPNSQASKFILDNPELLDDKLPTPDFQNEELEQEISRLLKRISPHEHAMKLRILKTYAAPLTGHASN